MRFVPSRLKGAYLIEIEPHEDERGFFARTFCADEFNKHGLSSVFVQSSLSYNKKKGTIRGMHFQATPHQETKLVQCVHGEIFDVIIDLREGSETYMQWEGFVLSRENRRILYIPKGFAHGFQTLADDSDIMYMMDEFFCADSARGIRFDDRRLNIPWPIKDNAIISAKDRML